MAVEVEGGLIFGSGGVDFAAKTMFYGILAVGDRAKRG
jgi:hypothetical protein